MSNFSPTLDSVKTYSESRKALWKFSRDGNFLRV
jgi:hypothetical protein